MAAVNAPTNTKIKEQDISQKLQLFGIYSAFANGKVPSNKQIDVALNSALASKTLSKPSDKLSAEGKILVADLRDVIEKAKQLLLSKNEGNLIQDFVWQCTKATTGDAQTPNMPVDKDTAQQHGNEALEGLRTLGQLLITNGQFRKLLNDSLILLRDIGADAAQSAANSARPTDEQLNQIDSPAEDNVWHEAPDLSKDNLKAQAKAQYEKNRPIKSNADPADAATDAQNAAAQTNGSAVDSAAAGAGAGAASLKDKIPEEHKQAAQETLNQTKGFAGQKFDQTKGYLSDKVPKERREQTIWRLRKMVVEIQGHQDYQRAIETLLRLAETYGGHASDLHGQGKDSVKGAHTDTGLQAAEADLKVIIERFANSTSTDDLFDSINQIYRDAEQDPELRGWFKHLDTFIRKCLKEQGFILQDAASDEWNKIYDQGNFLLRERYRNHTNRIIDEVKFLADHFDKDPQNHAFAESVNKLFRDLGQDQNGKAVFKKHLLKDVTEVILPAFFENVRYVPIPRIEYSDPMADAIIENLVIEGDNLAPNVFEFGSDNYFRWGRKHISNQNKNKVMLAVSGIQMDLRDVSYYIKKKQGFPSITDKGVMDIFLGGSGFSFKAQMETADKSDKNHFFKVNTVTVDVKNINIRLKQSNHKLLFGLVKPLLLRVMKPILQRVLSAQIKNNINQADHLLFEISKEQKRLAQDAQNDPESESNLYSQYVQAFQTVSTREKEKKPQDKADKRVNMAMTQHDSIFKDIKLPGGVSSKATEYKELAAKGEKWESPVFSIGSSQESTNIPKVAEVVRKPHNVTPSQLRDKSEVSASQASQVPLAQVPLSQMSLAQTPLNQVPLTQNTS